MQPIALTLNQANYLRKRKHLKLLSVMVAGPISTSSPIARYSRSLERRSTLLFYYNVCCVIAITLFAIASCYHLQNRWCAVKREEIRTNKNSIPSSLTAKKPSYVFKRDATAVLSVVVQQINSFVQIVDPEILSMSEKFTFGTPRMQRFVCSKQFKLPVLISLY